MAEILPLPFKGRRRALLVPPFGPGAWPDPRPFATHDVRRSIELSGLDLVQIAASVNEACRTEHVDPHMVERWYLGLDFPRIHYARAIFWLGGHGYSALGETGT